METLNYNFNQRVAEICDLFTELQGAWVTIYGPDKQPLHPIYTRSQHRYCQMVREKLSLEDRCVTLDDAMMKEAAETRSPVAYTCHAGLQEMVFPLFVDDQLAGFVVVGKFRTPDSPKQSPYQTLWTKAQNTNQLQEVFSSETAFFTEKEHRALMSMFEQIFDLIINNHMIQHKKYDLIAPIIEEIQQHPEHPLSLDEAAGLSGRSRATVTRLFRKITGKSFKQYELNIRLRCAKELLVSVPSLPIAEVAAQSGFEDPFYFSRVFHAQVGLPPSEYREKRKTRGCGKVRL